MLDYNGFSAWVTVDDAELPIYGVEVDHHQNRVSAWIPSEAGKSFTVHWKDNNLTSHSAGYVSVDGVNCGGRVLYRHGTGETTQRGVYTSATTLRPFMFSSLNLTDDDSYLGSASSENIGEILLEISWIEPGQKSVLAGTKVPEAEKVHERSKKATAHRVGFGAEKYEAPQHGISVTILRKIATFVFKYRALDMLKATGIVNNAGPSNARMARLPDSEAPAPPQAGQKRKAPEPPVKEEIDEEEEVDEEGIEEELKALQARMDAVKAKKNRGGKRIKSETRKIVSGEVIDLTDVSVKTGKKPLKIMPGEVIDLT
ncbi:hypothetical protein BDQ12DRAFT_687554 [Crucibulum laeve]|uniref:DUF7918 domain-containing protein n=1 Tax=Crucibulum laeve TaxID=68775 RepID=A0A5C3LS82_9AGAR|nr:hypothetical protein BDQ12DRAFT_687554 [Crucibulum laeve]